MPIYNDPHELINDAVTKGLVSLGNMVVHIGDVDIQTPNAINIIDVDGWRSFLQHIADTSNSGDEVNFVKGLLQILRHLPQKTVKTKSCITDNDVETLKTKLDSCHTVDDILAFMNQPSVLPTKLTWKRPVFEQGILRYYSHDTSWFIARQVKRDIYYSIFNPENREIARFDTLRTAKNNMINIIKCFS
jgi:hypothetical protein